MKKNKLAAILLACCATVCSLGAVPAGAINLHDEATMTEQEKQMKEYCDIVINCVNNERTERGLSQLATFPELSELSYIRAQESTELFDHTRPDGTMCFSILKENGLRYSAVAENLAGGRADPVATVDQWMNSTGHRANILGEKYTHIGIGYYYDPNSEFEYYWSMFLIARYDGTGTSPYVFDGQYMPGRELGDVDGSHTIDALDAKKIIKYAASRAAGVEMGVVQEFMEVADLNGDGVADARDASAILAYSAAVGSGENAVLQDFIW